MNFLQETSLEFEFLSGFICRNAKLNLKTAKHFTVKCIEDLSA
jgi:hypothetical protein